MIADLSDQFPFARRMDAYRDIAPDIPIMGFRFQSSLENPGNPEMNIAVLRLQFGIRPDLVDRGMNGTILADEFAASIQTIDPGGDFSVIRFDVNFTPAVFHANIPIIIRFMANHSSACLSHNGCIIFVVVSISPIQLGGIT